MKKTPLNTVKATYTEKKSLISKLVGKLERQEGESKADLEKRLSKVSSKKLLNLKTRMEEVEKIGGRQTLIDAIHDFNSRKISKSGNFKENTTFKKHLEKRTLGDLLDQYKAIQKKLRSEAK